MHRRDAWKLSYLLVVTMTSAACGESVTPAPSPQGDTDPPVLFTLAGTLTGLSGSLVLQNNGGDDLTLTTDGSYAFATPVAQGAPYDITVAAQPVGQSCRVEQGTGVIAGGEGGEMPLEGTVKDNEITFSFWYGEIPVTMTGKVDGDTIKGTFDAGGQDGGDWAGKRAPKG